MGRDLYQSEPVFRDAIDACAASLGPHHGPDILNALYPPAAGSHKTTSVGKGPRATPFRRLLDPGTPVGNRGPFFQTGISHPAIFAFEYALASLLIGWGIRPIASIGHSIGEYAAACLAGVFSLEDAMRLVAGRARLIQALPPGAMVAVPLAENDVLARLGEHLFLAAVNAPGMCVVSGHEPHVSRFERELAREGVASRRLNASHPFHSPLIGSIREDFLRLFDPLILRAPGSAYVSNLTGSWISSELATDPEYWFRHTCGTVRFLDGVRTLHAGSGAALQEVGPGRELAGFARLQLRADGIDDATVLASVGQEDDTETDSVWLAEAMGRLWLAGIDVRWDRYYEHEQRRRIALPTYPFALAPVLDRTGLGARRGSRLSRRSPVRAAVDTDAGPGRRR